MTSAQLLKSQLYSYTLQLKTINKMIQNKKVVLNNNEKKDISMQMFDIEVLCKNIIKNIHGK